jgi:hypothetical protein
MMVKLFKYVTLLLFLTINSQVFAISGTTMESFSPSLINIGLRQYQLKLNQNLISKNIVEPSKFYTPAFYDKNELKEVFETYEVVRAKVENPIELKERNLVKNMEMSILPHFKNMSTSSVAYSDFMFSLELRAVFL